MQPVKMTRAEYIAKYGIAPGAPSVSQTPVAPVATPTPVPQVAPSVPTAPIKMSRAEYQAKFGTPPPGTPAPAEESGSGVGNFLKGIVSAPATLIARPFQAAADFGDYLGTQSALKGQNPQVQSSILAQDDARQTQKQTQSTGPGGIVAPIPKNASDVVKDVGRGVQTVAFGTGAPLAGGAAFGFGSSLESQGSDALTTAGGITNTVAQTLIGMGLGKALDLVGKPLLNAAGKAIGTITPQILKDVAEKGSTAVTNFMAHHEIVPSGAKPAINAIPKAAEAFDKGVGKLFTGAGNVAKGAFQSQYPNAIKDEFQKSLDNAEKSIYPTLSKNEKTNVQLKEKGTLFGTKSVPDLQNNPSTKPIIESVANLPDDIKVKPSDTVAVKDSKLKQGITRLHQDTSNNLAQPEMKAATVFKPTQYDAFMKEKVLDPIESEFGKTSKEFLTAKEGVKVSKQAVTENNAFGSHEGRQNFDTKFKEKNPRAFKLQKTLFGQLDPNINATIETGRAIRNAMNDFTESLLPENHPYRFNLKEESNLIKGLEQMRNRSTTQLDKNAVTRALDRNPAAKKVVKAGVSALKLGGILGAVK